MIQLVYPTIGKTEIESVIKVLKSHHLERGDITLGLEEMLRQRFNSQYAITTTNGTAALFVTLLAYGVSKGDEIITTPFSFIATVNAILLCEATPVFVDIDQSTFNINASQIEAKITKKTKAILAVDLYGHPAEYKLLRELADQYKLLLISDACQAIGALYQGKTINHYADVTIFSFFNSKNLTSGEGGVVLTNSKAIADKVNLLINHGQKRGEKYNYLSPGWNFRPTDIQSAITKEQLERLEAINAKRNKNAAYFIDHLSAIQGIICPKPESFITHAYSRFTIRVTDQFSLSREELKKYLLENGVETEVAYPKPLYDYPHVGRYKKGQFPVVEKIVKQILGLPIHQNLTKENLNHIVELFRKATK